MTLKEFITLYCNDNRRLNIYSGSLYYTEELYSGLARNLKSDNYNHLTKQTISNIYIYDLISHSVDGEPYINDFYSIDIELGNENNNIIKELNEYIKKAYIKDAEILDLHEMFKTSTS